MKSIQTRFVVLMIAIVSFMLTAFGTLNYADSKAEKHKQLSDHLQAIRQRLSQSLPAVIWRFDDDQVRQIVDAELGNPAITGIAVYDDKHRLLYSAPPDAVYPPIWSHDSNQAFASTGDFPHEFPLSIIDGNIAEPLGMVQISASSRFIDQALQREAIRLFTLILLMNLVIVGALCAVMRWVIMEPLYGLRNALRDIATDGADLSLRLPASPWKEFEDLIDNFNTFIQRLDTALGAPIDEVHQTISRIAQGDFSQTVQSAKTASAHTIIARLAYMQSSLVRLTEELRHAKHSADSASKAKTEFLANMSHEIRTPLNAILGMTRLAMRGDMQPAQQAQLNKVVHSAQHLLGLINDILDFSKIEAGQLSLEQVPFALSDVLDNVVTLVSDKAVDQGLELVTDVHADVPWALVGDPLRLSQILLNFATNALKFTQRGEVVIYLYPVSHSVGKVRLRLGVRDTGIGIPADKQSLLFQNFVQTHASISRQYGGTGLGLAITRQLALLMHGQVGVQSIEGVGSDFWCEVELGCQADQDCVHTPLYQTGTPTRVLVVDDNSTAREILVRLLRDADIQACGVASGPEAMQTLRNAQTAGAAFDCVMLDELMQPWDGIHSAAQIQALPLENRPQLVLLSASSSALLQPPSGFRSILPKPFNAHSLRQALHARSTASVSTATSGTGLSNESLRRSAGAHLLLVEDIEINREVAIGLLEDLGIGLQVDVAENGQIALDMMTRKHYDGIFMDMHMPIMDGLAATQSIRRNPVWAGIPIIAMTANQMESDLQRCKAAGMCDFVSKPIDPERLRETLRKWIVAKPSTELTAPAAATPAGNTYAPGKGRPILATLLANIEGLDVTEGLRHFGGRQATYREMLRQFVNDAPSQLQALNESLQRNNIAQMHTQTHALVGAAVNVGARQVAAYALQIQSLIGSENGAEATLQSQFQLLHEHLHALCAAIRQAIPNVFS